MGTSVLCVSIFVHQMLLACDDLYQLGFPPRFFSMAACEITAGAEMTANEARCMYSTNVEL